MTDDEMPVELARRIVAACPELFFQHDGLAYWKDNRSVITDREWLHAMHEAEKTLNSDQRWTYDKKLCVALMSASELVEDGWLWHATARQRAEAFLATIHDGK